MKINVSDLKYYFDAKQKDSYDSCSTSAKTQKVLALRDRLLSLSDTEFETIMQTLNGLLDHKAKDATSEKAEDASQDARESLTLFEKSRNPESTHGKIDPI